MYKLCVKNMNNTYYILKNIAEKLKTTRNIESAINELETAARTEKINYYRIDIDLPRNLPPTEKENFPMADYCHYPTVDGALRRLMKDEKILNINEDLVNHLQDSIYLYYSKLHKLRAAIIKEKDHKIPQSFIDVGEEVGYGEHRYTVVSYHPESYTVHLEANTKTGKVFLNYIPIEKIQLF